MLVWINLILVGVCVRRLWFKRYPLDRRSWLYAVLLINVAAVLFHLCN